jgi:cytochrome c oxidase subunit 1
VNADTSAAPSTPQWLRGRFAGWIFATDHKRVGALWLAVGGLSIAIAGVIAVVLALQTAREGADLIGDGTYASLATMQGTLLTYGGVLPLALGLAVLVVPLQIGARGLALSGLAASGLWFGIVGLVTVVLSAFAPGDAPRSWWTTHPPLALDAARPGETIRLMGLLLVALAVLCTALALLATLRAPRADGMTDARLPLFTRAVAAFSAAQLLVAPVALLGTLLLLLAREQPGSFDWYVTDDGELLRGYGWVFDQTVAVLAIVIALGVAAEIVATFSRAPLGSRRLVHVCLLTATAALVLVPSSELVGGRLWAALLALVAAVPIVLAAVLLLPVAFRAVRAGGHGTPVPFALGALALVVLGALASVVFALDHDGLRGTTFDTARLTAFWGATFVALLGGVTYWSPKLTGRLLDARLTSLSAAMVTLSTLLAAIGFALAGLEEQPSRTGQTLADGATGALLAGIGVIGVAVGILVFGLAQLKGRSGRRVGNDPWHGDTLEWYTTSPPPPHNFTSLPPVTSERPVNDLRSALRDVGAL